MKIAIYAGMFKEDQDGSTKTLYRLTDTLLNQGFEVGIWAFASTPLCRQRLTVFTIPSLPLPLYPDYRISLPLPRVRKQLTRFRPDVIHITVPDFAGLQMTRFAGKRGIPVITSYHTDYPSYLRTYHLQWCSRALWRYFRYFYNRSQAVLVPTHTMGHRLKSNGIGPVTVWGRGIHSGFFHPRNRSRDLRRQWKAVDRTVILYCGRFVWYKALNVFIEVYQYFMETCPRKVRFVLAGDGPVAGELQSRMPEAVFTGYLRGRALAKVYASSDIFLFPSATETFGNVVLEALASGLPSVVSAVGGCREIVVRAGGGMVCPAGDSRAFYRACRSLMEDSQRYAHYRRNGIRHARSQDWRQINMQVINWYYRLVPRKRKRGLVEVPVMASK